MLAVKDQIAIAAWMSVKLQEWGNKPFNSIVSKRTEKEMRKKANTCVINVFTCNICYDAIHTGLFFIAVYEFLYHHRIALFL